MFPRGCDIFFRLEHPTIAEIRSILEWTNKNSLRTEVSCLEASKSFQRHVADKSLNEILDHVSRSAKPFFRVILRKNFNWFLTLSGKRHIEDVIEVGLRGVDIGHKEYFIQCFLKKELLVDLRKKFRLIKI